VWLHLHAWGASERRCNGGSTRKRSQNARSRRAVRTLALIARSARCRRSGQKTGRLRIEEVNPIRAKAKTDDVPDGKSAVRRHHDTHEAGALADVKVNHRRRTQMLDDLDFSSFSTVSQVSQLDVVRPHANHDRPILGKCARLAGQPEIHGR
jgi:hypothetical protein